MDLNAELSVARLEVVLSTIFYQLNKRMPTTHQINVDHSINLLLNFLLASYDPWVTHHTTVGGWLCAFTPEASDVSLCCEKCDSEVSAEAGC